MRLPDLFIVSQEACVHPLQDHLLCQAARSCSWPTRQQLHNQAANLLFLSCQSARWRHGCIFNYHHHHHHHHHHTDSNNKAEMSPSRQTDGPRPTRPLLTDSPPLTRNRMPASHQHYHHHHRHRQLIRQTDGPFLIVSRQSSWTRLSITAGQV